MSTLPAPFGLSEGLPLENLGVLLRWGAKADELRRSGGPTLVRNRLCWTDAVILGGLSTRLDVSPDRPLEEIRIYPAVIDGGRDENEQFDRALQEVTSRIGPPHKVSRTESSLAEGPTYPKASWSFEDIAIQVAIFEGMGAIYIPFFQMKILHRARG